MNETKEASCFEFDLNEHQEFCNLIKNELNKILKNEPLLNDLDQNISLIELKNILSLEHGESMNIFIRRADNQVFNIIVKQNACLKDLKENIKNYFITKNQKDSSSCPKAINWKYIWKNYCLMFENEKLINNKKELRDYGIKNRSELFFYKLNKNDKKKLKIS